MPGSTSKLIKDLNSVPAIVGALGTNIAEAQKALNLDYLDNLERLLGIAKSMLAPTTPDGEALDASEHATLIQELITQLAPSRYQFSETTLDVKLDLAQTMDLGGSAQFSAGFGAIAVSAALTVGYGFDYRAAAEVRTVLHAVPASDAVMTALLNRAAALDARVLTLPPGATIDQALVDKSHAILSKLLGADVKKPEEEPQAPET